MRGNHLIVAAVMLAVGLISAAPASPFADLNLDEAVRRAINKPAGELTAADLAAVKEIVIPGGSVITLDGIDKLKNLARLDLAKNPVRDLSPLARCASLQELNLTDTFVVDFNPIGSCRGLKSLALDRLGITDIAFVSGLAGLERLSLTENRIVNIDSLQHLHALKYLALSQNQITSVAPLLRNAEAGGLGPGDEVRLDGNPLTSSAYMADIPLLESRGVKVSR